MTRRRDAILREMGLAPLWRLRGGAEESGEPVVEAPPPPAVAEAPLARPTAVQRGHGDSPAPARRPAAPQMPQRAPVPEVVPPPRVQPAGDLPSLGWDALEARILGCEGCVLCQRRKQAVPGVGDRQADWLFVGEGPGAEEDERGEPFVGQAGRLLDNMLAAIGLKRGEDVYIANAVKCRPPHNRTPERGEIAACLPYLDRQIALVQPQLLIALGRPAAQALLDREIAISAARGKRFERAGVAVVVTYHPAYLLRNPQDKAKAWEDLCFARRLMAEAG